MAEAGRRDRATLRRYCASNGLRRLSDQDAGPVTAPDCRHPGLLDPVETPEDHFLRPPPPPESDRATGLAWAALLRGPARLVFSALFGISLQGWVLILAVASFVGGFATLVARMRDRPASTTAGTTARRWSTALSPATHTMTRRGTTLTHGHSPQVRIIRLTHFAGRSSARCGVRSLY